MAEKKAVGPAPDAGGGCHGEHGRLCSQLREAIAIQPSVQATVRAPPRTDIERLHAPPGGSHGAVTTVRTASSPMRFWDDQGQRRVTHKATFTTPLPFPESGRLFMSFNQQLLTVKPLVRSFRLYAPEISDRAPPCRTAKQTSSSQPSTRS